MSKVICEREDIVAIADAVRSKTNSTNEMTLGEIEQAVYDISSATPTREKTQKVTENGTVVVTPPTGYALSKVTFEVNVPNMIQKYIDMNGKYSSGNKDASFLFYGFKGTTVDALLQGVDTSAVKDMSNMFCNCTNLISVPAIDMRSVSTANSMFSGCKALKNCSVRNININLTVGSGTSYGNLLTVDSLLSLCKECLNQSTQKTLTIGTANLAKLADVYVKNIHVTSEMRKEDDLIDKKYPFVVCESTDSGAMLIEEYMTTYKKWSLK